MLKTIVSDYRTYFVQFFVLLFMFNKRSVIEFFKGQI